MDALLLKLNTNKLLASWWLVTSINSIFVIDNKHTPRKSFLSQPSVTISWNCYISEDSGKIGDLIPLPKSLTQVIQSLKTWIKASVKEGDV